MSVNRLGEYLDQMIEATQQACSYIDGMSKSEFLADKKIQQAVILNMVILGESATRLLKTTQTFLINTPLFPGVI